MPLQAPAHGSPLLSGIVGGLTMEIQIVSLLCLSVLCGSVGRAWTYVYYFMQGLACGHKAMPLTVQQMVVQQLQLETIRRREAVCPIRYHLQTH